MAEPRGLERGQSPDTLLRDRTIEQQAESEIDRLIDPGTSSKERERRIHRLTEGPPEFVDFRRDLPRNKNDNS